MMDDPKENGESEEGGTDSQETFDCFFDKDVEGGGGGGGELVASTSGAFGDSDYLGDVKFWSTEDTKHLKHVDMRLFFDERRLTYYCGIRKQNVLHSQLGTSEYNVFTILAKNIKPFREVLEYYMFDIQATPYDETPKCLKVEGASLTDFKDKNFWKCARIVQENIMIRPFNHETGGFMIKLLEKRQFRNTFPDWLGRSASFSMDVVKQMCDTMRDFEKNLKKQDQDRLLKLKEEQQAAIEAAVEEAMQ